MRFQLLQWWFWSYHSRCSRHRAVNAAVVPSDDSCIFVDAIAATIV